MNPQDPLANLHPLREPQLINWWPPAPGWWALLVLAAIALATLAYLSIRRWRRNAYRRQALLQLQQLHERYQEDQDATGLITHCNALLKSVALIAFPRDEIASSHGEQWLSFLNQSAKPGAKFEQNFTLVSYQKNGGDIDTSAFHQAAQHWIRYHRGTL